MIYFRTLISVLSPISQKVLPQQCEQPLPLRILLLAILFNFTIDSTRLLRAGDESPLQAGLGIMVGEVDTQSALVQVRITRDDHLVEGRLPGEVGYGGLNYPHRQSLHGLFKSRR
ncbi:MAG: hypothetical protein R3C11_17875 [Planctomycetaceae bacterium]